MSIEFSHDDFSDTRLDYVLDNLSSIGFYDWSKDNWEVIEKFILDLKQKNAEEARLGKVEVLAEKINALGYIEKEDLFDTCFRSQCGECSIAFGQDELREKEIEIEDLEEKIYVLTKVNNDAVQEIRDLTDKVNDLEEYIRDLWKNT